MFSACLLEGERGPTLPAVKNFFLPISLKCISSHNNGSGIVSNTLTQMPVKFKSDHLCSPRPYTGKYVHWASKRTTTRTLMTSMSTGGQSVIQFNRYSNAAFKNDFRSKLFAFKMFAFKIFLHKKSFAPPIFCIRNCLH